MNDSWWNPRTRWSECLRIALRKGGGVLVPAMTVAFASIAPAFAHTDISGQSSLHGFSRSLSQRDVLVSHANVETKSQLAVDLISYLKRPLPLGVASPYADVATTSPSWPYIELALKYGVVAPDNPHRFGAQVPVTGKQVAAAIAHLYGVPTSPSFSQSTWAVDAGLMTPWQLAAVMTHQDVQTILGALSAWALLQKDFPQSWTLSQEAGTALAAAISAAGSTATYQMITNESWVPTLVLTKSGQNQRAYVEEAKKEAKQVSTKETILHSSGSGKTLSILTQTNQTVDGEPNSATTEYLHANTLSTYFNRTWKRTSLPPKTISRVDDLSDNLMVSGLSGVQAVPLANGGYQLTARLTPIAKKQAVMRALSLSHGFVNSPLLIDRYLADTTVTYDIELVPHESWFNIVMEDVHVLVRIPARDFGTMTGQSLSDSVLTQFSKYVSEVDESVSLSNTITYVNKAVKRPKGIPRH